LIRLNTNKISWKSSR